jgi:hypothetical protein
VLWSFWRLILLKVQVTKRKQKVERTSSKFPNGIKTKNKLCPSQSMLT